MDLSTLKEIFSFVEKLTDDAGKIMSEGFFGEKEVRAKNGPWDLVTSYDEKVEKFLIDSIKEKYPSHLVVAEEEMAGKKKKEVVITSDPTWLIDPIDGTYNYAHGLPLTCISVALAVEGEILLGIVYNPLTQSKYTAIKGQGAFLNGNPIHASKQEELEGSIVSFELALVRIPWNQERNKERFLAIASKSYGVRNLGSAALTLCMVASGGIDAYFQEHLNIWDLAAGVLILEEAGGYVCHCNGAAFTTSAKDIVATANKKIAEDLLEIFEQIK